MNMRPNIVFCLFLMVAPLGLSYILKNDTNRNTTIEPRKFNGKNVMSLRGSLIRSHPKKKKDQNETMKQRNDTQVRYELASKIGLLLVNQASKNNEHWERDQFNFYSYINSYNVSIEVCSIARKLTYVQFHKYLIEQRGRTKSSKGPMTIGFEENKDKKDGPVVILIEYNTESEWDYPIHMRWRLSLTEEQNDEWKIFQIEQNGGCPEVGKAKNSITMDTQNMNLEPRLMAKRFYSALADGYQLYDDWSEMMADGEFFDATACTTNATLSREEFLTYMEMFLRIWEFNNDMADNEQAHFNLILSRPDRYIFRHTLPAIMYRNEPGMVELHDSWELKVLMNYNENGDGEWKINHIDLGCPVLRSTTDSILIQYGKKVVYDITKGVKKIVRSEVSWTEALSFLDKYIIIGDHASLLSIDLCNNMSLANYTHDVWQQYKVWATKKSYVNLENIDWSNVKLHETRESFELVFKTSTYDNQDKIRFIDWKFTIGFYHKLSYFYVSKLFIGCPKDITGSVIRIWKKSVPEDNN